MKNTSIFYNPNCTKCRLTKELLCKKGIEPIVIEYLDKPPSKTELLNLTNLGIQIKDLVRTHEDEWKASRLDINSASDEEIINTIIANPIILQRPIVIANGKAVIGRPPENVLEIL